jgi:glycosyltransferase involved in cell wall biosynthesis
VSRRILLVSHEHVGARMAGPGIRYYQFAKELSQSFDVTLVIPNEAELDLEGVEVVTGTRARHRLIKRLARGFDVVIAQFLDVRTMRDLARSETMAIYDLYVPFFSENLGLHAGQNGPPGYRQLVYRSDNLIQEVALATGNAFICASERQRDAWLGLLGAAGRLDLERYRSDPTLETLIAVVPFGLEAEPPRSAGPRLKGVVRGIAPEDRVLIWGGGIWNWFDPLTAIRAVAQIAKQRSDVKLFFLGGRHPNPAVEDMSMAAQANALAGELGVLDRFVFFHDGWVPYEERASYLLESDLGISTHFDNVETRLAFRTRILDHFWAGLPTVATRGGALSDLVAERGLGAIVEPEDPDALAEAILRLLDDEGEYGRIQERIAELRPDLAWPTVIQPLAGLASRAGGRVRSTWNVNAMVVRYFSLVGRIMARRPERLWKVLRQRS